VQGTTEPDLRRTAGRGELVQLVYRLGHGAASGVLTLTARATRPEVFVLRRGAAVCAQGEPAKRTLVARLARAAAEASIAVTFESGVAACPPGALQQVSLAGWVRSHIEAQLDGSLAETLVREFAGICLLLRTELAPQPLDEADRRMLAALAQPRRLDQIWPLARTPRFRLLAFLHFLRAVGALATEGVAETERSPGHRAKPEAADQRSEGSAESDVRGDRMKYGFLAAERDAPARVLDPRRVAAMRLLGVDDDGDAGAVKRAYRRLARALHPDLQPHADAQQRRTLERRFAEVTAAYEALV